MPLLSMKSKHLLFHEWALVLLFSGSILLLSLYSYLKIEPSLEEIPFQEVFYPYQIVIEITGAVKKSGLYNVPNGTTVKEAIDLAGISDEADLQKINGNKLIKRKQKIHVPFKRKSKKNLAKNNTFAMFNV